MRRGLQESDREGVVCRGHGVPAVDQPLQNAREITGVRRMDGDVVDAAVSFLKGNIRAIVEHEKGLFRSPDCYAATVTRPPLKPEELLPETCGPFGVSDLQMNRSKGEEVLIYQVRLFITTDFGGNCFRSRHTTGSGLPASGPPGGVERGTRSGPCLGGAPSFHLRSGTSVP